jgi:hypothetical protein
MRPELCCAVVGATRNGRWLCGGSHSVDSSRLFQSTFQTARRDNKDFSYAASKGRSPLNPGLIVCRLSSFNFFLLPFLVLSVSFSVFLSVCAPPDLALGETKEKQRDGERKHRIKVSKFDSFQKRSGGDGIA